MKKMFPFCCFILSLFQFGFSQTERTLIPLYYNVSGYNDIPLPPPNEILTDTIPSIKAEMNVNEKGALTYMLPIEVIKGNNDFQPNLSLGYNSHSGEGMTGWGWNIVGLSSITQGGKSKEIDGITIGSQYNANDPFYLDGQRLLKTSSTTYVTEKYSKIKITKPSGTPEYSFTIQYTDGKVAKYKELTYGQHYISVIIDSFGNEIHYTYSVINNIVYANTISYGGNSVANDKFFINFIYNNKDIPSAVLYRNNTPYRNSKYLAEITVSSSYLPQNNGLYRKYLFSYDKIRSETTERLRKVEIENETGLNLKPLHFNYNNVDFGDVVSTVKTIPRTSEKVKVLGDVAIGDFYGTGEPISLYEVKNFNNKYNLFSPKTGHNVFLNGLSKNSKKYYSGKVLYNDNNLSESDDLIVLDIEYLSPGQHTGVIDRLNFLCKNLTTNKTKTITIELPGDVHTLGPQYDGHECKDANGVQICPASSHRNMTERDIIVGDFNNDGLTDVFIIQPGNNNHIRTTYFFELGKYNQDTYVLDTVTGFNGYNVHYSAYTEVRNIFPIEFDGDGIPELLFVRQSFEQLTYKLHYYVVKFDYLQKKFIPVAGEQNILIENSDKDTPLIFGDFNGDGLTDFMTPQKVYKVEGSSTSQVINKINTESLLWWQYISTGTGFIKTQKDYTQQQLAYIVPSQRNVIKKSSAWTRFWSGNLGSYNFTEFGASYIIPVDFNNDGKTDFITVRKFGKVKYHSSENLYDAEIKKRINPNPNYPLFSSEKFITDNAVTGKILFHNNKLLTNGDFTFENLNTEIDLDEVDISPFSLILNYTDYNYLNTFKSGIFIHDVLTKKEHRHIIDNDNFNETLIREIDNGSPVIQKIEYKPMLDRNNDKKEDVYTISEENLTYPYHLHRNQGTHYLTHKIHTFFDDNIVTKEYRYQDGIQHLEGRGFLGFKKTFVSDPYESKLVNGKYMMKNIFEGHFWTTTEYEPLMENAPIATYYGSLNPNSVFSRTETINEKFNKGNNRYLILPVVEVGYDFLQNTTISKIYDYDETGDLLLDEVITDYDGVSSSVEKYFYKPESTSNGKYFFGQINKTETIILRDGNSFFTKEEREFNTNGTIKKLKKSSNNSPEIVKDYTYYPFGEIHTEKLSTTGIPQTTTTYEYDTTNRYLKKVTSPEGLITEYTVNALGKVLSEISPLGHVTSYGYDAWGNVKRITDYLGKKTFITKGGALGEASGYYSVTTTKEGEGTTVSIMDIFDREIKTKTKSLNNQWIITEAQYNIFGQKTAVSEPYIQGGAVLWNTIEYDEINRPVKQTVFNGKIVTTCYEGNKVTVEDGHKKTARWVDATGAVTKHQDEGGTIFYKYYPNGSLKEADYDGMKTLIEIDDWGNKKKLIDPSAGTYQYEYDNLGRIKKETNPKGGVTQYTYDNFGKLISENTSSPSENTTIVKTYSYDATTKLPTVISGTYNGKSYTYTTFYDDPYYRITGKKEQTPDFTHETSLTYDGFGRMDETEIKTVLFNPSKTTTTTVKNEYDSNGILIKQYDGTQLIWEVNNINAHGQVTQMQYGNGYVLNTTYNNNNLHLEEIKHISNGSTTALHITYDYHATKGVLLSRNNLVFGKNETYTYDDLDRLLEERVNNVLTQQYTYDKRGRMTYNSDVGKLNFNNQNYKLKNIDFNDNGVDLKDQRGFAEISYNAFKSPNEIFLEGKDRISYDYSILRTRSASYFGNQNEDPTQRPGRKFYSADKTVEIVKSGNNAVIYTYITGDAYTANYVKITPVFPGYNASESKYYIHRDNQGTILALTNATNGKFTERRYFDAWGNLKEAKIAANNNSVFPNALGWIDGLMIQRGYTGHEHLTTVGLIHMNGRIYDPVLRRFMSPDNFVQDTYNTQNYNRYAYVLNNPLLYTDPSGEFIVAAAIGLGVAILVNGINNSINKVPFWYGAGKSGTLGAISGAISFGIGQVTSNFIAQAALHGTSGAFMNVLGSGNFDGALSGFAAGAISSLISSGIQGLATTNGLPNSFGSNKALFKTTMIANGGLSGGISSSIAGGNFWDGARQGIITSGLNHAAHGTLANKNSINEHITEEGPEAFPATVEISKSVPKEHFKNIALIDGDDGSTYHPTAHEQYNGVDGLFLSKQPEDKTWYKVSDGAKATVYYKKSKGLYVLDTTSKFNPVRAIYWKYYVDWVDKTDTKRNPPPGKNPYLKN